MVVFFHFAVRVNKEDIEVEFIAYVVREFFDSHVFEGKWETYAVFIPVLVASFSVRVHARDDLPKGGVETTASTSAGRFYFFRRITLDLYEPVT